MKNVFSKKYINKYTNKINYLGPNSKLKVEHFLLSRLFLAIILLILCLLIPNYGLFIAIIVIPLFYYFYTSILIDNKIAIRNDKLYEEAIIFFEMLYLALRNNGDLKIALDNVTSKLGNSLSLEFKKVISSNKYDYVLKEIFDKVNKTIPNYDVRNSLVDLKESKDYLKTIDKIIDNLHEKNALIIKQKYVFKPIILSVVSIMFIALICYLLFNIYNIVDFIINLF